MDGHHLILGELVDFLTGNVVSDTHDERYRQKIARRLVDTLGYEKADIISRWELIVTADDKKAKVFIDFVIRSGEKIGMLIKYGPGSLTTRHQPALAMACLVNGHQVPVVVVANGEDAETLDTVSEKVIARGIDQIPNPAQLSKIVVAHAGIPVSPKKMEMAARIVYCYEIDGACPCDTTVCRLENNQTEMSSLQIGK